ncbi:chemotaxis protein CheW [Nocardioides sp. Bht2]|uniref:chemotaxis protein CheW n=1 Tax=Nocardioides sp. Bht2 TaxID=3392297 RepID=UPI0039B4431A
MSLTTPAITRSAVQTQYCTFWVRGLYFGVAVQDVQEVLRSHQMTPVPQAPEAIRGLINLRGQIVTALDLRRRLALDEGEAPEPMNVIVRSHGEAVSLLVDQIGDVIDTGDLDLHPTPSNLPVAVQSVLHGVIPLPEAILLVLDPDQAVEVTAADSTEGLS